MIKSLFTESAQIAQYIGVDISGEIKAVQPYAAEANRFVKKILGETTFTALLEYANNAEAEIDEALEDLLDIARMPAANFAYMIGADKLIVKVGSAGISEISTNNLEPVTVEKLNIFKKACASSGYNGLEELILFVKSNKTTYADSWAFLFDNGLFINSASEINTLIYTDMNYRDFLDLKSDAYLIEHEITAMFGADLVAAMKAEAPEEPAKTYRDTYILPAIALRIYGQFAKSEKHTNQGNRLFEQMRNLIAEANETIVTRYNNEDNPGTFVFG